MLSPQTRPGHLLKTTEMQDLKNLILTEDVVYLVGLAKSNPNTVSTAANTDP